MRLPSWLALLLLLAPLSGCPRSSGGGGGGRDDDDSADDDDAGDDDAGDDDDVPSNETDCTDGVDEDEDDVTDCDDPDCATDDACVEFVCDDELDEDGDGAVDCADSDCEEFFPCTWPLSWQHSAVIAYDANTLAKIGGYSDCTTEFSGTVTSPGVDPCATCDRDYTGAVIYTTDTCSPQFDDDPPSAVSYGIVFDELNPTCVTVYAPDGDGNYGGAAGQACDPGDGTFALQRSDPVVVESLDVGTLSTTLRFSPL